MQMPCLLLLGLHRATAGNLLRNFEAVEVIMRIGTEDGGRAQRLSIAGSDDIPDAITRIEQREQLVLFANQLQAPGNGLGCGQDGNQLG
jgi:hypothetical protein